MKGRCDNNQPRCSRCTAKAIECQYPANRSKAAESKLQHGSNRQLAPEKAPSLSAVDFVSTEDHLASNTDSDIILDSALAISDPDLANLEGFLGWDDPGIDFDEFLNPQTEKGAIQSPTLRMSSLIHSTPTTDPTIHVLQGCVSSPNLPIPRVPSYARRSIMQRPKMKTSAHRVTNLILHNLRSYPLMMRHPNNLPPFIHPSLISSDIENDDVEPLTNCISLVYMISSQVQGSRKLFWKNVQQECERWCEEVRFACDGL